MKKGDSGKNYARAGWKWLGMLIISIISIMILFPIATSLSNESGYGFILLFFTLTTLSIISGISVFCFFLKAAKEIKKSYVIVSITGLLLAIYILLVMVGAFIFN